MQNINLLQKPIISIFDCKNIGTCTNLIFNKNYKCIYIETSYKDMKYFINVRDIVSAENDGILIKNLSNLLLNTSIDLEISNNFNISTAAIYLTNGTFMGNVKNILLDNKFYVSQIITDKDFQLEKNMIYNLSNEIILAKETQRKNNRYKYKPKSMPKSNTIYESLIVSTNANSIPTQSKTRKDNLDTYSKNISKILNRQITKDIFTTNGEIIAKSGSKITKECLKRAKTFGKLYELIKFSR